MKTVKGKAKFLIMGSVFVCFCAVSDAQDYYGGGGGGSWRKQQANNSQQKKDKEDEGSPEPSGYLSINYGFATPEGGFSSSIGSNYGGYAMPGDVFHFSLGLPINHSNFGVAFMLGSYNNNYDLNTFANNNEVFALPSQTGQTVYSESSIMGGGFYTYPIGRLSIDCRVMIGALLSSLPEQNIGYEDNVGDQFDIDTQPSNSTSFAFDAGVGARFLIAEFGRRKLCAMVNVDYLYSSVSYNTQQYQYETYATGVNAGNTVQFVPSPIISGSLPIQLFNVTFGIGYQL